MVDRIALPDYEQIEEMIGSYNASELHGLVCGMLCLGDQPIDEAWVKRIAEQADGFGVSASGSALNAVFDAVVVNNQYMTRFRRHLHPQELI